MEKIGKVSKKRNVKKTQNVTNACGVCRKLKIRCNGQNPCHQCERRGEECKYYNQSKRGPKRNHDEMEESCSFEASPSNATNLPTKQDHSCPLENDHLESTLMEVYQRYCMEKKEIELLDLHTLYLPLLQMNLSVVELHQDLDDEVYLSYNLW